MTRTSLALVTVRDATIELLRRLGMTHVFGNPGSTELPMFRDFPDDFRYILGLQEAVVVGMADGYAQATGNAALVNLHSAAGVGNAMGNIFTAFKNRTPLVITAGQQARSILPFDPFLASSQATELPKPYVKWSIEPARAQDVPLALARAYHIAMQEPRGPVLVSIPVDDWDQPTEPLAVHEVATAVRPDPVTLARMGDVLDAAQRPAFVVGAAVDRAGAWDAVVQLAEAHNARVFTAPMAGRGAFPEDHRLFAGFLPAMREKIVSLLQGHDVVFVLGAPAFTYHVEGRGPHVPVGAKLVQLVDDPATAAWTPEGISAVGNIRLGVLDLLARPAPPARPLPPPRAEPPPAEPRAPMSVAFVLHTLNAVRGPADIVVEEAPSARATMQTYLPMRRPGAFYTMDSGGLGYGMPAAVGVALARPGTRVIGLIGDGSSMYSIQALWSAAQLKLPMTFVILNNHRYAALQDFAPVFGFGPGDAVQGTDLHGIDFVGLARAMGCTGQRVSDPHALEAVLRAALQSAGPTVIEVEIA
ncbi:Benzoylformate decarboxylase [Ralstonia mannitolilytica]|uniref:benzoylformate decarboxylase n=1 Tax=Ralstonia mannitolilytica TaxID=105219 RepID=UPI0007AFEA19|nr:benzoylformate decarboxylase [Ralstonia mannitolilytica]ANA32484.1 benzoylformate decarboxylase [Ralstonia mannitolilytica]CAJ0679939.1 Benzoylformate decarboxylase [Ralstonia mannitolilytica]CAJ0847960.1 Benzoylformate decarboxylase [Ralstonia mannitolilytica]